MYARLGQIAVRLQQAGITIDLNMGKVTEKDVEAITLGNLACLVTDRGSTEKGSLPFLEAIKAEKIALVLGRRFHCRRHAGVHALLQCRRHGERSEQRACVRREVARVELEEAPQLERAELARVNAVKVARSRHACCSRLAVDRLGTHLRQLAAQAPTAEGSSTLASADGCQRRPLGRPLPPTCV